MILVGLLTVIYVFVIINDGRLFKEVKNLFRKENTIAKPVTNCIISDPVPMHNYNRIGPIFIKIADEWIFDDIRGKFIRIGFEKEENGESNEDSEYIPFSPKALSIDTHKLTIVKEESIRTIEREIFSYDILIINNEVWLDIYLHIENLYDESIKIITKTLASPKGFYIFHPYRKKWFGAFSIENIMYSDIYNESNTKEDVKRLLDKSVKIPVEILDNIINKRTLIVPSVKFYNENIEPLTKKGNRSGWNIYGWYVEKEEVEPKNDDDE